MEKVQKKKNQTWKDRDADVRVVRNSEHVKSNLVQYEKDQEDKGVVMSVDESDLDS